MNPKLRFKEFSGEWEEKIIGEITRIKRGSSPRPINSPKWFDERSNTGWLRISDISSSKTKFLYKTSQFLSIDGEQKTTIIDKNNLVMSICGSLGKPIITKIKIGMPDSFVHFDCYKINMFFFFFFLENFNFNKKLAQPGSQLNLNSEIIRTIKLKIPSIEEQNKIGELFNILDKQIDLLVHKLQLLEVKKKYLWKWLYNKYFQTKKSKLLDILKIYDGYPFKTNLYNEDGKYKIITIKNISNNGMIGMNKCNKINDINSLNENLFIKSGDVICAITGAAGFKVCLSNDVGLLNQRLLKITSNTYSNNIILFILENNIELITSLSTGSQMNISKKDIENILIPNIEKGSLNINNIFFEEYNLLLLKLKNKINLIKSRKLYFLNKMFI